jgi:hypothetical protein
MWTCRQSSAVAIRKLIEISSCQAAVGVNVITAGRVSGFIEGDADFGGSAHGVGCRAGIRFQL